jgi:hypothetical protein
MSSIELYINDEALDLRENERIPITFQTQSIQNVVEARGNFSRSFDVPRTDKNNRLLEVAFDFNTFGALPHRRIPSILRVDGYELPSGFVIIENDGITESEIKLTYYSGNSNFFQTVSTLKLKDCNFGNSSHFWNYRNAMNTNNQYWVYPYIEYTDMEPNTFFSNQAAIWSSSVTYQYPDQVTHNGIIYLMQATGTSLNERPDLYPSIWLVLPNENKYITGARLLPALYANAYKEAIELATGYNFEGEIFTQTAWTNLIFPFSGSKLKRNPRQAPDRINMDLAAFIGQWYLGSSIGGAARNNIPLILLNPVRKYGNDNLVSYVTQSWNAGTSDLMNPLYHLSFPDYTISKIKFKARIDINAQVILSFEFKQAKYQSDTTTSTIKLNTVQGLARNSLTNATIAFTQNAINPAILTATLPASGGVYDWWIELECEFLTGLDCSIGVEMTFLPTNQQVYIYETQTSIRYISDVPHQDLINYRHGLNNVSFINGIQMRGKGRVHTFFNTLWWKLNVDSLPAGNDPISSPSSWERVFYNHYPVWMEANEEDYDLIKYGGLEEECRIYDGIYKPQYSWITGSDLVPDITAGTWIKNMANMFGCVLSVDEENKKLRWKKWEEIYEDTANATDWSKALVNTKNSKWNTRASFGGQASSFRYKDVASLPTDYANYTVAIDDTTIQPDATIYQLDWGATATEPKFDATYDAPVIKMFGTDGKFGQSENVQRVLYLDKVSPAPYPINFFLGGRFSETNSFLAASAPIPYAYFNNDTKTDQLGWDVHLYEKYHRYLGYMWEKYRVLTCEVILNASEIAQLDLLVPVYIDYYKCYFFIVKIQDWTPNKPCKVQLLKLF